MAEAHNDRRYEAGDKVKLGITLHHKANLREVRLTFVCLSDKSAPPIIARGEPHAISERDADGSVDSRVVAEVTLPRAVVPGTYELVRIGYETAGGQLGHLEKGEDLPDANSMAFEVFGEPEERPSVVEIDFADS